MRVHSASLVEQTLIVSQELIRVSILWTEMWHGGLEEASREYFGEKSMQILLISRYRRVLCCSRASPYDYGQGFFVFD
jgi:phosphatidylinositol kinase/protein kinase (PI-3  family)